MMALGSIHHHKRGFSRPGKLFMSVSCHDVACGAGPVQGLNSPKYRAALWIALAVNAAMFAIEITAGLQAGSVALLADAIDFFGDAANYAVSLAVLSMAVVWRARAALLKAATMLGFGVFVLVKAGWAAASGVPPEPITMGAVGLLALLANMGVAWLLYAWREGDANMRSAWLCSRNDAIGNVAVMIAALGVLGTGTPWPDIAVAAVMAGLALTGGVSVIRQARQELRDHREVPSSQNA
jgi:cation diffusion facilitator family transporter